jgi:signal transduction histidine kinase/ABC-type amino acid transport substrate-binding protein
MTHYRIYRTLTGLLLTLFLFPSLHAQEDTLAVFTEKNPLVYEDAWDLWPYSFLNDQGEPDGYNIDLIRMLMKELNIPYTIRLKPAQEAFEDLKAGKSDLTLGLSVGFHDDYGLYGQSAITLFTQSVATPEGKPIEIRNFHDLGKDGVSVIVNANSLCYHLMVDYGWEKNASPTTDLRDAVKRVSTTEEGQIVWNTLSLKWLIDRYHIDNLELTPVNMPHGEYRFMAQSQQLLNKLDATYKELYTTERIQPLQDKWFYPELQKPTAPSWTGYALAGAGLLLLIALFYAITYRLQNQRLTKVNNKRNRRLALILETSSVRLWTYNVESNTFDWRNENGQVSYTYTMEEFAQRYTPSDFDRLKEALDELAASEYDPEKGERQLTLELKARDNEDGDSELLDFIITLSVLRRDKEGKPTVIIGTKKNITKEKYQQRLDEERTLRYWSIFYTPVVGILLFDKEGRLQNINPKACELFDCDPEEVIDKRVPMTDFFDIHGKEDCLDGIHDTQVKGSIAYEYQLMTVKDDAGEQIGTFATCIERTSAISEREAQKQQTARMEEVKAILKEYDNDIDSVLKESDIRLINYSPESHLLTIYQSVGQIQYALTQTRCMSLVDDRSKKLTMRTLSILDDATDREFNISLRTTLRVKNGLPLYLRFYLKPTYDKEGQVTGYSGMLRDETEIMEMKRQMTVASDKVQEVENTKNMFVKNMVQEIRKPMQAIIDYVEQLDMERPNMNEGAMRQGILDNADYLLHLIDNILYLSRLEAHMVDINKQPRDFAGIFEAQCKEGWQRYQNANTQYVVENPYSQLVVDIDADNLGHAFKQIAANAAQHTRSGIVRARYDYIGRRLVVSFDDTGEGIPKEELERLNAMETSETNNTKGLGLAITKELVRQMGGTVEISSEEDSGTTVYITIPCHASVIKRKKLA